MSVKPLAVMLDITSIPYGRGVSRYTANLARALFERNDIELHLFGTSARQRDVLEQWCMDLGNTKRARLWSLPQSVLHGMWNTAGFPTPWMGLSQIEVYHAWDWQLAPITKEVPQVVTIHDLAYKLFPETAHPTVVAHYDRLLKTLEENSGIQVIAVSQATKNDLVNLTSIDPERIHVVYEALPEEARYVPSAKEVKTTIRRHGLTKPFLMWVGTAEPRKNLQRIIAAWEKVKDEFDLVLAGGEGWEKVGAQPGLHHLGYVDATTLACLYREAHALVYASLYEGFGLPILEAYFHGCPVITSRISSLPEVAGKPAILVDPYNETEIAEAFVALEDRKSSARKRRKDDMYKVLESFSWEEAAARTRAVYALVAQQGMV